MKIYITGLPSGYEVEHLVRLFYPMAPLTLTPPEAGEDCVWAEKKPDGLWAMVRQGNNQSEETSNEIKEINYNGEEYEASEQNITLIKGEIDTEKSYRVEFEKDQDTGLIYRAVINEK